MAKIRLKIMGLPQTGSLLEEDTLNLENTGEIVQRIESRYPRDYYTFAIFLNGAKLDDESKILHDGDEIIIMPVMSGG